jgi:hypothetical protein
MMLLKIFTSPLEYILPPFLPTPFAKLFTIVQFVNVRGAPKLLEPKKIAPPVDEAAFPENVLLVALIEESEEQ